MRIVRPPCLALVIVVGSALHISAGDGEAPEGHLEPCRSLMLASQSLACAALEREVLDTDAWRVKPGFVAGLLVEPWRGEEWVLRLYLPEEGEGVAELVTAGLALCKAAAMGPVLRPIARTTSTSTLSRDLTMAIGELWDRELSRTGYVKTPLLCLDGPIYTFTDGYRCGESGCVPKGSVPDLMAKLGTATREYVLESKAQDKEQRMEDIERLVALLSSSDAQTKPE